MTEHTGPSEEQVREWLEQYAAQQASESAGRGLTFLGNEARMRSVMIRAALALLDAGRKDLERVDWLEHQAEYGRVTLDTNNPEFDNSEPKYTVYASAKGGRKFGETLRAAIDRARGA